MNTNDEAKTLTTSWRTLEALYATIATDLEKALQKAAGLSVVEFSVLDVISEQSEGHLRMQEVAKVASLSVSATTRLVNRLEDRDLLARVLCADDRRGIFTELTPAGRAALETARPVQHSSLKACMAEARKRPEFAPLVNSLQSR